MSDEPRMKVRIPFAPDAWHGYASEGVWARAIGEDRFMLLNTPFFAKDLSFEDVISVRPTPDGLEFLAVVQRSGHSTYRLVPTTSLGAITMELENLRESGCTWEEGPGDLLAVDVPPSADIHLVYAILESGIGLGIWDFEEGHVGHPIRESEAQRRIPD